MYLASTFQVHYFGSLFFIHLIEIVLSQDRIVKRSVGTMEEGTVYLAQ